MKFRTLIRIIIITSIVLLSTGFIMFSFFKLSVAEEEKSFNLYSLIPLNASAVVETHDIVQLVKNIDEMECSKDHHYLSISRLFATFKSYLNTLLEDTPHGLSRQMNKMLFSFHEPDNEWNQVLYCSLGSGDYQLLEKFVSNLNTGVFSSRFFDYKGEKIRIYPMSDGSFISCYITSNFLVLSYQKRLIEQVIDTHLSGKSLLKDRHFSAAYDDKKQNNQQARIYTRMYSLNMGRGNGDVVHANLGNWTEFEMKMNGSSIFFSGISHEQDSSQTFMDVLRKQQPIKGFSDRVLPTSTFFFSKRSVSDLEAMLQFTAEQEYATMDYSDLVKQRDRELFHYLKENGGGSITSCLFHRPNGGNGPASVMSIPLIDAPQAERLLRGFLDTIPALEYFPRLAGKSYIRTVSKVYRLYVLPYNTLFTQLTGMTKYLSDSYACFYNDRLLLAPDGNSLSEYIQCMDEMEALDEVPFYKKGISGLSDTYHFMLVVDMEDMIVQPDAFTHLVPSLFFRNPEFFRHFTLSAQFVCNEGVIYPNVVLSYKGK